MDKVLLITDLDRTLLDAHSEVPQPCIEAIAEFTAKGGLFSVCTGRPTRGALLYNDLIRLVNTPIISYNGACIYDTKTANVIWRRLLPDETEMLFKTILERFPAVGMVLFYGSEDLACTMRENEYTEEVTWRREHYRAQHCALEDFPKPWNKCVIAGPEKEMAECAEFIRNNMPCPMTFTLTEGIFLEIIGPDVDKGKALFRLTDMMQIPMGNVVAIGDSMNDLPMLRIAGNGVAVANAEPDVLNQVKNVVAANTEFGVRECIEKWAMPLLNRKK